MVKIVKRRIILLPLIVLLGPTAVGKTKIAVELAVQIGGEIISGDSMQVYRQLNIGTAKIKSNETKGVPHYLIDIKEPDENFSVAEFQNLAEQTIAQIHHKKKLPILVGGTGLYIQAVIDPYDFTEQLPEEAYRQELHQLIEDQGLAYVHQLLSQIDPAAAERIHVNDEKRIIRALEYYKLTGQPISQKREVFEKRAEQKYQVVLIGLTMNRSKLYERINLRVDQMMEEGFLKEVEELLNKGYNSSLPALQGLGYKHLINHLEGECSLARAVELIKRDTRRFAKRQLTWFRRDQRIHWFNVEEYTDNQELILEIISIIGRTINKCVE